VAENDISAAEVHRLFQLLQLDVRDLRRDLVGRAEYESDQEGINRRFEDSGRTHTTLEAKVAGVDAKYAAEIKDLRANQEAQEKEQRANRSKWQFAIVMAVVTPILALIVNLIA